MTERGIVRSALRTVVLAVLRLVFRVRFLRGDTSVVVLYYAWPDFQRKVEAISDLLRSHGIPTRVQTGTSFLTRARIKFSDQLHIGFWNTFLAGYLPKAYIFFNAEPLSLPRWSENEDWTRAMSGALEVWGYAPHHQAFVEQLGVPYRYVPFGYAPTYERSYQAAIRDRNIPEDIDILFFGFISPRRREILGGLREAGLHVHTVTYENPLHGAALLEMIARARINLVLFAVNDPEAQVVDLARVDQLLANGRFVIHERPPEPRRDLEFERNVTTCAATEMPDQCRYYLANAEERRLKAETAKEWFSRERALDSYLPYDAIRHQLRRLK